MRSLFTILIALIVNWAFAQQTAYPSVGDEVTLNAGAFKGTIQWQASKDEQNWENLTGETSPVVTLSIAALPLYIRAEVNTDECISYSETVALLDDTSTGFLLWSDPETWGGTLPEEGDDITISEKVLLDISATPQLGSVVINGQLAFDRIDAQLSAENIVVNGALQIGSREQPFEQKATITITGTDNSEEGNDRGIMVNGTLELHGATPDIVWTKINQDLALGDQNVELIDHVTWEAGGEIIMAPTDYFEAGGRTAVTQKTTLTEVSGSSITTSEGSNSYRWGRLQYATPTGLSLDESAARVEPPIPNSESDYTPTILDERAEVGYLTRNIVIESTDDGLWRSDGFGVHIMIMPTGVAHVDGIEIKRGGQRGHLRRYPWHWHNLSYTDLQYTSDATGQYFNNSVVNESKNRGIVIHGTNGVEVRNNIVYHIEGHGVFTEDAVERRNLIDHNLVLHIRPPVWGTQLKNHEQVSLHDGGASGFWLSNPDNIVTNNTVADSRAFGFWLAFPTQAWGDHIGYLHPDGFIYQPHRESFDTFEGNTAHSNRLRGVMLDLAEINNEGDVGGVQYASTSNGQDPSWPFEFLEYFTVSNCVVYKNGHNGFWDRSTRPITRGFVSADNCGRSFAGAGNNGLIEQSLVIGTSLNHGMNGTGREALGDADFYDSNLGFAPSAFATYHHTFVMKDNIVMEFPLVAGERSGVFASEDYYIRSVEKGHVRNTNNRIINSHPGYKATAPYNYFTFSSAIWDANGYWGNQGDYFVYDDPFLTFGKEVSQVGDGANATGGVMVSGPFYGFRGFILFGEGDVLPQNRPYFDLWAIHISRLDHDLNEVAAWNVAEAQPEWTLQHMRDFATSPEGIYELSFPGHNLPTDFSMLVDNMLEPTDQQLMSIEFDGTITDINVGTRSYLPGEVYTEVGSFSEVRNSDGGVYWQDSTNDKIWVMLRGGVWEYYTNDFTNDPPPSFEDETYKTLTFYIQSN